MKNIHILPTDKPSRLRYNLSNVLVFTKEFCRDYGKQVNKNIYITSDEEVKEGDWFIHISYDSTSIQKAIEISNHILDNQGMISNKENNSKIILTTDQDLIKDGVQAIDDEFLEWFVKNPSCEWVEVEDVYKKFLNGDKRSVSDFRNKYKIIIPKEEPKQEFLKQKRMSGAKTVSRILEESKQETLEEAAENYGWRIKRNTFSDAVKANELAESAKQDFIKGAKWQQEQDKDKLELAEHLYTVVYKEKERMYSEEEVKEILFHRETHYIKTAHHLHINEWFEQFKKK